MTMTRTIWLGLLASFAAVTAATVPASAQQPKPNIMFIMGDDIGWMQPSIYHRGLVVGDPPPTSTASRQVSRIAPAHSALRGASGLLRV